MMEGALEGLTRPDGTRPLLIAVTQPPAQYKLQTAGPCSHVAHRLLFTAVLHENNKILTGATTLNTDDILKSPEKESTL